MKEINMIHRTNSTINDNSANNAQILQRVTKCIQVI